MGTDVRRFGGKERGAGLERVGREVFGENGDERRFSEEGTRGRRENEEVQGSGLGRKGGGE